jgi:Lrp/AsnC family leucine-responsive transcriptional regulator
VKLPTPKKGTYVPGATDKKLLAAIADNSRASYVELSKAAKLTANACKYRLRNMERTGVIQGYTLNIEPTALGYQWYTVQLTIAETDIALLRSFYRFCEEHPDILFYYHLYRSGAEDFDIGFLVKTHDDLRKGLNELKQKFPGIMVANLFLPYVQVTSHSLPPAVFR